MHALYGREISVIRDGNYPTSAGSGSAVVFDTFRPGPPDLETWIGHQLASAQFFRGLQYPEGNHYPDGGWWNSMRIQVRSGGTWNEVSSQFVQPSYPAGSGPSFATYVLTFSPVSGDAIRIFGTPGGTAAFVSIAELRVYGDQMSTTPTPPPAQTTGAGTITAGVKPPTNGGFSVFVFGGGTNAQLASAAGCGPGQGVFWVTNAAGEFVTYVVGTQISAVNALWNSMFANGIAVNQPMIGTCR